MDPQSTNPTPQSNGNEPVPPTSSPAPNPNDLNGGENTSMSTPATPDTQPHMAEDNASTGIGDMPDVSAPSNEEAAMPGSETTPTPETSTAPTVNDSISNSSPSTPDGTAPTPDAAPVPDQVPADMNVSAPSNSPEPMLPMPGMPHKSNKMLAAIFVAVVLVVFIFLGWWFFVR